METRHPCQNYVRQQTKASVLTPACADASALFLVIPGHGREHGGVLPHAEVVVGAPHAASDQRWSAALFGLHVPSGDFVLVGRECCQDFGLLALRDLEEVKSASEFCGHLVEFGG